MSSDYLSLFYVLVRPATADIVDDFLANTEFFRQIRSAYPGEIPVADLNHDLVRN
jgi:hypothetical protein